MTTVTNFAASVPLVLGSNVVSVIAWDSRTNLATNRYGVIITNGLPTTLKYDANGNLTNQHTSTYTNSYDWDGEDRLIRITRRSTADPIEYKTEFLYDGFGRRVQILEKTNGVVASSPRYLWCGTELCEARGSGGGTATRQYVSYGEHQVGDGLLHYTFDHLGSVRDVHGGQEGLRARFEYDPYGRKTTLAGTSDVTFGYTGHFHHTGSGLHLAMFRALDSGTGRWLSRDPIKEAGGLNYYAYVGGDPINANDALGLYMNSLQTPTGAAALAWAMGATARGVAEQARQWGEYSVTGCQADPWRLAKEMFNPLAMLQDILIGAAWARLAPWLGGIGTTAAKTGANAFEGMTSHELSSLTSKAAKDWVRGVSDVVPARADLLRLQEIARRAVQAGKQSAANPVQSQRLQKIQEALKNLEAKQ